MSALRNVGETLDKPGAAVRGILSGLGMGTKPGEWGGGLLNLIPFSDTLGITNPEKRIQPEDLTGLKSNESDDWLTKAGKFAANTGVGVVTDPLFWTTAGIMPAMSKGANALRAAGGLPKGFNLAKFAGTAGPRQAGMLKTVGEVGEAAAKEYGRSWPDILKGMGTYSERNLGGQPVESLLKQPVSGLFNIGPMAGGRKPWATLGTGRLAQKMARLEDIAGGAVRYGKYSPVPKIASLVDQLGTQGFSLGDVQRSKAPLKFSEQAEAAGVYERQMAGKLADLLSSAPEAPRPALLRLADARPGPDLNAAVTEITTKHGWTPKHAAEFRALFDEAAAQDASKTIGANARQWESPYASYLSRQAAPGVFPPDPVSAMSRQRGLTAGSVSDISRNLALDLPGGQARVEALYSHPDLEKEVTLAGKGLKDSKLAKIMRAMPDNRDIPDFYLDQKGWKKVRDYAERWDPSDFYGTLRKAYADPEQLRELAGLAGAKTKNRFRELAHIYLRATPEGRKIGLFQEPLTQTIGRMARDQKMRVAHGDLLADLLARPGALSEEGIFTRTNRKGVKKSYRPTSPQQPLTEGDLSTKASLLHGGEDEGFLQFLAKKRGIDPTDTNAMDRLKLSAVEPKLAEQVLNWHKGFDAPEAVKGFFGKVYDPFTGIWASGVTARPAFVIRNLLSGNIKAMLDQMWGPGAASDVSSLLRGKEVNLARALDNPMVQQELARRGLDPAKVTAKQATDIVGSLMHQYTGGGLQGMSHAASDVVSPPKTYADFIAERPGQQPITLKGIMNRLRGKEGATWNPAKAQFRGVRGSTESTFAPFAAAQEANRFAESHPRLTEWLNLTRKGYDPQVAWDMAQTSQFRYGPEAFTKSEKVVRRAIPFWRFQKQALGSTVKELAQRPGGPLGQLIKATGRLSDTGTDLIPDYLRQSLSIPIPEGTPLIGPEPGGDKRYFTGFGLMHEQDPFGFMGAGLPGAGGEFLSRTHPFIKGPLEAVTGKSFFQRGPGGPRDIEDLDPILGRILSNVHDVVTGERSKEPFKLPSLLEQAAGNSPLSSWLTSVRTLTDPRKNWSSRLLNTLTGARLTDVPERAMEKTRDEITQQLMREAGARQFVNVYFPKWQLYQMTPQQRERAMLLQGYKNLVARQQRERARRAALANVPLPQ